MSSRISRMTRTNDKCVAHRHCPMNLRNPEQKLTVTRANRRESRRVRDTQEQQPPNRALQMYYHLLLVNIKRFSQAVGTSKLAAGQHCILTTFSSHTIIAWQLHTATTYVGGVRHIASNVRRTDLQRRTTTSTHSDDITI